MNHNIPILITSCYRFHHLINCLNSLRNAKHHNNFNIIIAIDYPLDKKNIQSYNSILNINFNSFGFKRIEIIKRGWNYGSTLNAQLALKEIFESHSFVICLEEDNVVGPYFYEFFINSLVLFQNKSVFSISSYTFYSSLQLYLKSFNFFIGTAVLLSKDKFFLALNFSQEDLSFNDYVKLFFKNFIIFALFIEMILYKKIWPDVIYSVEIILKNMCSVTPSVSLSLNKGYDGDGEHCSEHNFFNTQQLDLRDLDFVDFFQHTSLVESSPELKKIHKRNLRHRIYYFLLFLLMKISRNLALNFHLFIKNLNGRINF